MTTTHKVHFINGDVQIFYDITCQPTFRYFKGYMDCDKQKMVCIPLTSVLYAEVVSR